MTVTDLLTAEIEYVTKENGQKKVQIDLVTWQQIVARLEQLATLSSELAQATLAAELKAWDDLNDEDLAADEQCWDEAFANSQDLLDKLADEAIAEDEAGRTHPLDPDTL